MMPFVRTLEWRKAAWPTLLVAAFFYIIFHAISGEHGLYAWMKESRRLEELKSELAGVSAQRQAMEHRVKLLSDSSLDLDMLDEQARATLGLAGSDEVVILLPEKK